MGKSLLQQKRGKGSPTYRAPSHRYRGEIKHLAINPDTMTGTIIDIVHSPGHNTPLAKIQYSNGNSQYMLAPEGMRVTDIVEIGQKIEAKLGNTLLLKDIPEGTLVHNIESVPGDGGKFVRSSGTFARVVSKVKEHVKIQLPSKKIKEFNEKCRATIGTLAGGDRKEQPFVKAGKAYHAARARNKIYPKVSGVSMNAVDHPFGGSSSHIKGRPTQAPRNAPPGRKVGKIAPRRTGRKRR